LPRFSSAGSCAMITNCMKKGITHKSFNRLLKNAARGIPLILLH
jgi:hypothetical protein